VDRARTCLFPSPPPCFFCPARRCPTKRAGFFSGKDPPLSKDSLLVPFPPRDFSRCLAPHSSRRIRNTFSCPPFTLFPPSVFVKGRVSFHPVPFTPYPGFQPCLRSLSQPVVCPTRDFPPRLPPHGFGSRPHAFDVFNAFFSFTKGTTAPPCVAFFSLP